MRNAKPLCVFLCLFIITSSLQAQYWQPNGSSIFYNNGNVGIGTNTPEAPLEVRKDQQDITRAIVRNLSTGNNVSARFDLSTGTPNSYALMGLHDNAGSPYYHFSVGSAITSAFYDAPEFNFRNVAGDVRLKIGNNGNVGIGITNPWAKLDVRTAGSGAGDQGALNLNNPSNDPYGTVSITMGSAGESSAMISEQRSNLGKGSSLIFFTSDNNGINQHRLWINDAGNVAIGTNDTKGYKLAVNGAAIFTKVKVQTYPWPDYVFNAGYRLRPLSEVEQYIQQNNHLPEVPSAEEVEKNGLDVGDNQATLLKKIEELTLYMIQHNKELQQLKQQVIELQQENSLLIQELKTVSKNK
jgi:hypothetical protein